MSAEYHEFKIVVYIYIKNRDNTIKLLHEKLRLCKKNDDKNSGKKWINIRELIVQLKVHIQHSIILSPMSKMHSLQLNAQSPAERSTKRAIKAYNGWYERGNANVLFQRRPL